MKTLPLIFLLAIAIAFTACGSVTEETTDNFKQIILPDSSVVYLNHESKISYNQNFNPRIITLEGEAFFSVNDGKSRFKVKTNSGEEVIVKGTEFFMAASSTGTVVEVEHGLVVLHVGKDVIKEVEHGERCEFHRHDNGLHLGHAKHQHRHWISLMDNDLRKSGKVIMRSRKHAGSGFHPGNHPGNMKGPKDGHDGKPAKDGHDGKDGHDHKVENKDKGGNEGKGGTDAKGANDGKGNMGGKGNN